MSNIKGYIYAAASSSTFGLAPFFTISLLASGFSSFEVLAYRWGIASLTLGIFGVLLRETFRISRKDWGTVFVLSLLRTATSLSLVIAYQHIASGVASTIHFMYPLAVALAMIFFFQEKKSFSILFAVLVSLAGAALLSSGEIDFKGGNTTTGLIAATLSVFFYGGYIVGVRKSRAIHIPSTALTCYVMGLGALFFIIGGKSDRRYSIGNRRTNMAEYPRTGTTGNSYFKYHARESHQVHRPYTDLHLRSLRTSYGGSYRMSGLQRKFHSGHWSGHIADIDGGHRRHYAREENKLIRVITYSFYNP